MKTVQYEFAIGREKIEGSVEVEDDSTREEIDAIILDDATSCGKLSYDWHIVEG